MQKSIKKIIAVIPSGCIFDTHYIITCLIQQDSDCYLDFASTINAASKKTLAVHGQIGKEVAKFENTDIERLRHESWSKNIHGNASLSTCWRKLS